MPIPNTISDKATTLNLGGFLGNTLTARLVVAGSEPMPISVTAQAMRSSAGGVLGTILQPVVTIQGRVILIAYPASTQYPSVAWHQIRFGDRIVLAGTLEFNRSTVNSPTIQELTVRVDGTISIGVTLLVGSSAGGGESNQVVIESPISVSSGMLVGYVGATLVRYDATVINHAYGLLGVATNAVAPGQVLTIQQSGLITISGWGLTPGQVYRAGANGAIVTSLPPGAAFGQIVGRAKDSNTFHFSPQTIIKTNG